MLVLLPSTSFAVTELPWQIMGIMAIVLTTKKKGKGNRQAGAFPAPSLPKKSNHFPQKKKSNCQRQNVVDSFRKKIKETQRLSQN